MALELQPQPQLHEIGADLTQRTGLGERVTHVCGDALTHDFPDGSFDAVVSFLAIVHILDRPRLFARLARALRPGGGCYIEDLCQRAPFAASDRADLRDVVCANTITSEADYAGDLRDAGFGDVAVTDLTPDWAPLRCRAPRGLAPEPRRLCRRTR